MEAFTYKGITDGKYVEGDIEALNSDEASHKLKEQKIIITNLVRSSKKTKKEFVKVVSYSNKIKPEIEKVHNLLGVNEFVRMKSSYKFCVIATGEYDGYVAEPRACEWDIAAGHALLENAGGTITDFEGNEILYGKENFRNPSLILKRSEDLKY